MVPPVFHNRGIFLLQILVYYSFAKLNSVINISKCPDVNCNRAILNPLYYVIIFNNVNRPHKTLGFRNGSLCE